VLKNICEKTDGIQDLKIQKFQKKFWSYFEIYKKALNLTIINDFNKIFEDFLQQFIE